ncbi:dienelactone hydrolase family protein [Aurantivibrio plasticivorans]
MRHILAIALSTLIFTGCSKAPEPEVDVAPQPTAAQAQDIRGEEVTYTVGDTTLTGYIAYDANQQGQRPGVLIVHEWWGHNDYVRTRAHMLAKLGYTAFALDMYGDGKLATHPEDAQKFMMEVMNNIPTAEARFAAAHKLLDEHNTTNPAQTAAMGYCFGGAMVLHQARIGSDLAGVASFHGNLSTTSPAKAHGVNAKVLVLHGADDPFVPQEQVDAFKKEMAAAVADYKFIAYPGAVHAFTNPGATEIGEEFGLPLAYNPNADEQSWNELKDFLNQLF